MNSVTNACFTLHPSLRIVASRFPALTIWRMNVGDGVPSPVDLDFGGEDALVVRPLADVEVHSIPPGGTEFLSLLAGGAMLIDAAKGALTINPNFDLSGNISALVGAGAFVDYSLATDACELECTAAT